MNKVFKLFIIQDKQGFTLIEMLLACSIITLCLSLLAASLSAIPKLQRIQYFTQDNIAIHQIRVIYAQAKFIEIIQGRLFLHYHKEEIYLYFNNQYLVKSKGYEILLDQIDEAYFTKEENCIYLTYTRGEFHTKTIIGC